MGILQQKPETSCNRYWPANNAKLEETCGNPCIMLLYRSAWKDPSHGPFWRTAVMIQQILQEENEQWLLTHLTMTMVKQTLRNTWFYFAAVLSWGFPFRFWGLFKQISRWGELVEFRMKLLGTRRIQKCFEPSHLRQLLEVRWGKWHPGRWNHLPRYSW